jgi:hypothetical protein
MKSSSTMKHEVMDTATATPKLHLPDTDTLVQQALAETLAYCADKMRLQNAEAALEPLRQSNSVALSYAHYCLATRVGAALAGLDASVEAVFQYQNDATSDDLVFGSEAQRLPIHLIVLTERKTPALTSLAAALDRALTRQYAALIGPRNLGGALDVQLVDHRDVERRIGTGALLTSIYNPPLRVWGR